jgi:hypothetical protein
MNFVRFGLFEDIELLLHARFRLSVLPGTRISFHAKSSCLDLFRASTFRQRLNAARLSSPFDIAWNRLDSIDTLATRTDVDARNQSGHDDRGAGGGKSPGRGKTSE